MVCIIFISLFLHKYKTELWVISLFSCSLLIPYFDVYVLYAVYMVVKLFRDNHSITQCFNDLVKVCDG